MQHPIDTDPTFRDCSQLLIMALLINPWLLWSSWIDTSVSSVRFGIWKEQTCKILLSVRMLLIAKFIFSGYHSLFTCIDLKITQQVSQYFLRRYLLTCSFFRNPMSAFLRWFHICNTYCTSESMQWGGE